MGYADCIAVQTVVTSISEGVLKTIYSVRIEGDAVVYMQSEIDKNVEASSYRTLIVDSKKLLESWGKSNLQKVLKLKKSLGEKPWETCQPGTNAWDNCLPFMDSSRWVHDHKYDLAEKYFKNSGQTPIPLAFLNFMDGQANGFNDGITRTIWLLANGATSFPVQCYKSNFYELEAIVGVR